MTDAAYQNETRDKIDPLQRLTIDELDFAGADLFFDGIRSFWGDEMHTWVALDAFARDGALSVKRYHGHVQRLDLWEFNPEHREALEAYGCGEVRIGDSYQLIVENTNLYDFIMVDTPQGQYPAMDTVVTEHFDFLPLLKNSMNEKCVVAFYVNKLPYNRDEQGDFGNDSYTTYDYDAWMDAREEFYALAAGDPAGQVLEHEAIAAYYEVFFALGYHCTKVLVTPCYDGQAGLPPSFRCAMQLERFG